MVGIIDYGVGNLFSVCSSLRKIGEDACIVKTEDEIQGAHGNLSRHAVTL